MIILFACLFAAIIIVVQTILLGIGPSTTSFKAFETLKPHLPKKLMKGQIVDLGSGFGIVTLWLAHHYPLHQVVGYEKSWIPLVFSKILSLFVKNLSFKRKCIYTVDISNKSLIYSYLFTDGMKILQSKKFGGLWISYCFFHPRARLINTVVVDDIYKSTFYIYN